jgi:hypothetical protein
MNVHHVRLAQLAVMLAHKVKLNEEGQNCMTPQSCVYIFCIDVMVSV